jgi:hypothetical protein
METKLSQFDLAIKSMLDSLPTEPSMVKIGIKDEREQLFTVIKREEKVYLVLPKNMHELADSHLMQSMVGAMKVNKHIPLQGSIDLPIASVIPVKENNGMFFLGFVSVAVRKQTGTLDEKTSKWSKGVRCAQLTRINNEIKNTTHLKEIKMNVQTAVTKYYAKFQKDTWSIRSRIGSYLASTLKSVEITELKSYLKGKEYIVSKIIKNKFPWENGGLFYEEEIKFVSNSITKIKSSYNNFVNQLDKPDDDFVRNFWNLYNKAIEPLGVYIKFYQTKAAERAKILFPPNKSKNKNWLKMSLKDKLRIIETDKLIDLFAPWNTILEFTQVSVNRESIKKIDIKTTDLLSEILESDTKTRLAESGLLPLFLSFLDENLREHVET